MTSTPRTCRSEATARIAVAPHEGHGRCQTPPPRPRTRNDRSGSAHVRSADDRALLLHRHGVCEQVASHAKLRRSAMHERSGRVVEPLANDKKELARSRKRGAAARGATESEARRATRRKAPGQSTRPRPRSGHREAARLQRSREPTTGAPSAERVRGATSRGSRGRRSRSRRAFAIAPKRSRDR